jgi:hypothetical protein
MIHTLYGVMIKSPGMSDTHFDKENSSRQEQSMLELKLAIAAIRAQAAIQSLLSFMARTGGGPLYPFFNLGAFHRWQAPCVLL